LLQPRGMFLVRHRSALLRLGINIAANLPHSVVRQKSDKTLLLFAQGFTVSGRHV
jgi:hypothetical protein